ncbi:hypothetical protein HRbin33_01084 [bacterium HR33]|nr:hypothetical protein HRbin33_01084 [bacterium HR33]
MLRQAVRGDVKLPIAFWGLAGLGTLVVFLLLLLERLLLIGLWYLLVRAIVVSGWGLFVLVVVWRSSARHSGLPIWRWLARGILVGSYALWLLSAGTVWYLVRPDFTTTSLNVQGKLRYDPAYPYIGFWKTECSEPYGLVAEAGPDGAYFLRFCGPGGCFGKGPLNRVRLGADSVFRIIDDTTLGVPASRFAPDQLDDAERGKMQRKVRDGMLLFRKCS